MSAMNVRGISKVASSIVCVALVQCAMGEATMSEDVRHRRDAGAHADHVSADANDARGTEDTVTPADAGVSDDAIAVVDAGATDDTITVVDAGATDDTVAVIDASPAPSLDAGSPADVVSPHDAASTPPDAGATTGSAFYVDGVLGSDGNPGTSPSTAWRSLSRASGAALSPGDRLLFARGGTWSGGLSITRSGTATAPITVGAYGTGAPPVLTGASDCISLEGSYIVVQDLQADQCRWAGVEIHGSHERITQMLITGNAAGVHIASGSTNNAIVSNTLRDNNRMSVLTVTPTNDDSGAFGIDVLGDYNEIAYNTISGSNAFSYDYGTDGSAVEIYGGQHNTIHHNVGIDDETFTELGNSRSLDNVFAYNVVRTSLTTGSFLITRGSRDGYGPVQQTAAYNNTVYLTGSSSQGFVCYAGCSASILRMRNNVIDAQWKVGYADAAFDEDDDVFAGGSRQFMPGAHSVVADPQFVSSSSGDLHVQASSPAIDTGVPLGYDADVDGVMVPQDGNGDGTAVPDRGAYEFHR
jgi:hypothetical protein